MKRSIGSAALWLCLAAVASPLAAQLTIGTETDGNKFPFGAYAVTLPNFYQQVYGSSAFSGPITISSIGFHPWSDGTSSGFSHGEYQFALSTTSKAVDALTTDPLANMGPDEAEFFFGFLNGGFSVTGTPFHYDPALGNLLLTVWVNQQTPDENNYFASDESAGDQMSRFSYYNGGENSSPVADTWGLVTTFNGEPANSVPEPATMVLLGTGLAALARGIRRRRTV